MVSVQKVNREAKDLTRKDAAERKLSVQLIQGVYDDHKDEIEARAAEYAEIGFSDREAEVLALSEAGFISKATAVMLGISTSTVDEYKRRAQEKYDQANRMVHEVDRSRALERTLKCRYCGHGTVPSKSEAEITDGALAFRCRHCWEGNERRIW